MDSLIVETLRCKGCDRWFESPRFPGSYHSLVVWSDPSRLIAALTLDCPAIPIKSEFTRRDGRLRGFRDLHNSDRHCFVSELLADPAPDGSRYRITDTPPCPDCGWVGVSDWSADGDDRSITLDLPRVTFRRFLSLPPADQRAAVELAVTQALEKHPIK